MASRQTRGLPRRQPRAMEKGKAMEMAQPRAKGKVRPRARVMVRARVPARLPRMGEDRFPRQPISMPPAQLPSMDLPLLPRMDLQRVRPDGTKARRPAGAIAMCRPVKPETVYAPLARTASQQAWLIWREQRGLVSRQLQLPMAITALLRSRSLLQEARSIPGQPQETVADMPMRQPLGISNLPPKMGRAPVRPLNKDF